MNKVIGKIFLEKTGVGIPSLLVTVYDVDLNTLPEEALRSTLAPTLASSWNQLQGDRLGSVMTDENGTFELEYEDDEFQARNQERRPDLMLFVTAPEGEGHETCSPMLHLSCGIRQNAGRMESYLIQLNAAQLKEVGLTPPLETTDPETLMSALNANVVKRLTVRNNLRNLTAEHVVARREFYDDLRKNFEKEFLESISRFPKSTLVRPELRIGPSDILPDKMKAVIEMNLTTVINNPTGHARSPVKAHFNLNSDEIEELAAGETIPDTILYSKLFGTDDNGREDRPSFLVRENKIVNECLEGTLEEKCSQDILGINNSGQTKNDNNPSDGDDTSSESSTSNLVGSGVTISTSDDIPKFIAKLFQNATSPEEPVSFGNVATLTRPDADAVQSNVESLSIRTGPADTPAYYDFHNIQIAFDSLWQELFDKNVITTAREAYRLTTEWGGDPRAERYSGKGVRPLKALREEAQIVDSVLSENPDIDVMYRRFDEGSGGKWIDPGEGGDPVDVEIPDGDFSEGEDKSDGATSKDRSRSKRPRPTDLIKSLEEMLSQDYSFTVFAPDSVNFGIVVTYRQKWEPLNYQAGELVKTITLAPNQSVKVTHRTKINKKRSQKELEKYSSVRRDEFTETSRAESEIIRKALNKTNFTMSAGGSTDVLFADVNSNTKFTTDAETTSQEVKKSFREAVRKAVQEYKQERSIELTTEDVFEFEETETSEISNPNKELPVTFLFYELQRRYRVSEEIHRLTPVVLVAQHIPSPDEITEAWLIRHDWILRRTLLDDAFLSTLGYLSSNIVGDGRALQEMKKNVKQQRKLVKELKEDLVAIRQHVSRRRLSLEMAIEEQAHIVGEGGEGLAERFGEAVATGGISEVGKFFGIGDKDPKKEDEREAARIRQEAAQNALEQTVRQEKELLARLEREVTALNAMTESYTKALSEFHNRKVQIRQLQLHVKDNILYYMQAIWSYEHPDKRYFRLHQVEVPVFDGEMNFKATGKTKLDISGREEGNFNFNYYRFVVHPHFQLPPAKPTRPLVEVADLDNLLGFKGNYMIFPLKQSNKITDLMMLPYVDKGWQLVDPDSFGNMNKLDFAKFVCCLYEKVGPEEFKTNYEEDLKAMYKELLMSPLRSGEDMVVPTGSLFIEALLGTYTLLEDFMLLHRAIDVKKVQAEVREMELENLRAVARLLGAKENPFLLDDPDIESVKKVIVSGNGIVPNIDLGDDS